MHIAYKYLKLEDGILLIFEAPLLFDKQDVPLGYTNFEGNKYLKLGEQHWIEIAPHIIKWLVESKKLYIASSDIFSKQIDFNGTITLTDISIGKLVAYMEMEDAVLLS